MSQETKNSSEAREDAARAPAEPVADVPPRIVSLFDFLKAGLWFLFWLLPISYVNTTSSKVPFHELTKFKFLGEDVALIEKYGPFTQYLNNQYRVSCLFTNSVKVWKNFYAQVQLEGQEAWLSFSEEEFAPMHCFGYRTRMKRMYNETSQLLRQKSHQRAKNKCAYCRQLTLRRDEMATFVARRYEEVNPGRGPVARVRFVEVVYSVGSEEIAKPKGHWRVPPLDEVPANRRRVRSTHEVAG